MRVVGCIWSCVVVVCLGLTPGCGDDSAAPETSVAPADAVSGSDVDESGDAVNETASLPCGGPCPEGSICVHAAMDDSPLSCVSVDGVYDDGSDAAKAFESVGNGWYRKRADDWQAKGLRCNDGSPYGYYISPGSGDGRDKWVIFHKGGGGCGDSEGCGYRWLTQPQYMRQQRSINKKYTPGDPAAIDQGIYSREEPTNHFRNWTYVHLHYCSSDAWRGTAMRDGQPSGFFMRGRPIVDAVTSELLAGVDTGGVEADLPRLAEATDVLIAGGSAGASGSRYNMDHLATVIRAGHSTGTVPIKGLADAAWTPPVNERHYGTREEVLAFMGGVSDTSCEQAHPAALHLCEDAVHQTNGRGTAEYYGGVDQGHLGEAAPGESAVDSVFIFMAQLDGSARGHSGLWNRCVRPECASDEDCAAGQGCTNGMCLTLEPCDYHYCTPDDGACFGPSSAPACFGGVATHASACGSASACEAGERCHEGLCVEDVYFGCQDNSACPAGEVCLGERCTRAVEKASQCTGAGYAYNADSGSCEQVLGCSEGLPCSDGYVCVSWTDLPGGRLFHGAIGRELTGLGPKISTFAPLNGTHTAAGSSKYFAQIFKDAENKYVGVASLRVDGQTLAEALGDWYAEAVPFVEAVAPPGEVKLPLRATKVTALSATLTNKTQGTGCENDAVAFLICAVSGECGQDSALAIGSIGDQSSQSVLGQPAAAAAALKLVLVSNPKCTDATLALVAGDYIELVVQYDANPEHVVTRKVALPPLTVQAGKGGTLYIGVDGATWADAEFQQIAARRL